MGNVLSPEATHRALERLLGKFWAIAMTHGCIGNGPAVAMELRKTLDAGCELALLHVGQPNEFTEAVRKTGGHVHVIGNADALVGLSLGIAKDEERRKATSQLAPHQPDRRRAARQRDDHRPLTHPQFSW